MTDSRGRKIGLHNTWFGTANINVFTCYDARSKASQLVIASELEEIRRKIWKFGLDYKTVKTYYAVKPTKEAVERAHKSFQRLQLSMENVLEDLLRVFNIAWNEGKRLAKYDMATAHSYHEKLIESFKDVEDNNNPYKATLLGGEEIQTILIAWKDWRNAYVKTDALSMVLLKSDYNRAFDGIPALIEGLRHALNLAEDMATSGAIIIRKDEGVDGMKKKKWEKPLSEEAQGRFGKGDLGLFDKSAYGQIPSHSSKYTNEPSW